VGRKITRSRLAGNQAMEPPWGMAQDKGKRR
jgi:hypothetical protein